MELSQTSLTPFSHLRWSCPSHLTHSMVCKPSTQEMLAEMETKAVTEQHNLQNCIQLLAFSAKGEVG